MVEPGEHVPSRRNRSLADRLEQRQVEQLDRGDALVAAIAPPGQPDRAHPAPAQQTLEGVGPEPEAGQR